MTDQPDSHTQAEDRRETTTEPDNTSATTVSAHQHPLLWYTLARIGIFLAVAGVMFLVGARGLPLLIFALLISGIISIVVLDKLRGALSARIATKMEKSREERRQRAEQEDLL